MIDTIFFCVGYALNVLLSLLNMKYVRERSMIGYLNDMRGSAVVEYGIMAAMMATAFAGAVAVLGGRLGTMVQGAISFLSG